jgi:leader peptidase (prepilin peptidase)/N-methyltransferase
VTAVLVSFAGLLGLVIGSFLNVVVARVPVGASLIPDSRCPRCEAAIRPWQNVPVVSWVALRGRCAACREPISRRYPLIELGTGLAFAGVAAWVLLALRPDGVVSGILLFLAYAWFAAVSIALTAIDLDTRRLPDAVVLPSLAVLALLLAGAALVDGEILALARAAVGAASLYAFYLVLRIVRPGGMGGGDVKLAAVIGLVLGWLGWGPLVVGAFSAFVVGGLFGVALLLRGGATRRTAIPFGPWMLLGAWIGIVAGDPLSAWYLRLTGVDA